jgi:hypothetical protein
VSPWAELIIEGKAVDRTPISRYPLPAGKHLLVFRNPELGKEIKRSIWVKDGKVERVWVKFPP